MKANPTAAHIPVEDAAYIRFLLGDVEEAERQRIERACLEPDGMLFAVMCALEDELRFEYLHNRLAPADRAAFEHRYLGTADGRARLAFARALLAHASRETGAAPALAAGAWWRRPAVAYGLAAAVVLLTVASVALLRVVGRLERENLELKTVVSTPPALPAPAFAVTLVPVLTRSADAAMPRIAAADAAQGGELRLELPPNAPSTAAYSASLLDVDGRAIWSASSLSRQAGAIVVTIPPARLQPADYEIVLRAPGSAGQIEDLANYVFRVVR